MRIRILLLFVGVAVVVGLWWIGREDPIVERRRDLVEVPEPPIAVRPSVEPEPESEEPEPDVAEPERTPLDPVETGRCALLLKIVDAETNEPVRTEVVLWRLDAPASEHWTQGDQIQTSKLAGNGIVRFDDLPAGNYRAVCSRRRLAGEDSRVIHVQGELTEDTIAIHMPRKYRVYLKVFDVDGNLVTKGRIVKRGESRMSVKRIPKWRRPRRLIDPGDGRFSGIGMGGGTAFSGNQGWDATATEKGFCVGELEESPYAWKLTYRFVVKVPGGCDVVATLDGDFESGTTWVGLTVPYEPIRKRIRMPDGTRADKAGAYVTIWTGALRDDGTPPLERLRRETVRVSASLKGYRALRLKEVSLDGPQESWYLQPAARQG